ncbi:MAG: hypothetical protein NC097_01980 [Clostridium sp.]|nr:hypothetical protein [Prevotella sp.]MCM1428546.1 hypothetical protein [Clostridium sp.]MCM1475010.1 hypothetical protein [Muribaculaceae bacterium]
MTPLEKRDKTIAAAVTFIVAAIILLLLFFTSMNSEREALAQASIPEPDTDEVTFLETELIEDLPGVEDAEDNGDDFPPPPGEPDPAPTELNERVESGDNPEPAPARDPKTVQKKTSPVKEPANTMTDAERKRIASMAGKFSPGDNGSPEGKFSKASGKGKVNASGSVGGRQFLGCPTSEVSVRNTVIVKVKVRVRADGTVAGANAISGPQEYHRQCEGWAMKARWSAKDGAPTATGSITFTISPRK